MLGGGIGVGLVTALHLMGTEIGAIIAVATGFIAAGLVARRESGWGRTPDSRERPGFGTAVAILGVTSLNKLIATVLPVSGLPLLDEPLSSLQRASVRPYRRLGLPVGYFLELEFTRRTMTFLVRLPDRKCASKFVDALNSVRPSGAAAAA